MVATEVIVAVLIVVWIVLRIVNTVVPTTEDKAARREDTWYGKP